MLQWFGARTGWRRNNDVHFSLATEIVGLSRRTEVTLQVRLANTDSRAAGEIRPVSLAERQTATLISTTPATTTTANINLEFEFKFSAVGVQEAARTATTTATTTTATATN